MAFFGIEIKPGEPFIYQPRNSRLRLSQATLGIGNATRKCIVQFSVGNKSPVFLCCLLPDEKECCQLNVEYEEAHQVVFSVIGPRSVHLTGFYMSNSSSNHPNDESETHGEDLGEIETERSENSEESDCGGSSIHDDYPLIFQSSPDSSAQSKKMEIEELVEKEDKKVQFVEPPEELRCAKHCNHWRIQDQKYCEFHYLQMRHQHQQARRSVAVRGFGFALMLRKRMKKLKVKRRGPTTSK